MSDIPRAPAQAAPGDSRHRLLAALLLIAAVGAAALAFVAAGLEAGGGALYPPLDDAYIHFQYARSLAEGHPFRYNPDQPPTSGATSLAYPLLLAAGYWLGFQGDLLAWWALLIGVLTWLGSAWLTFRLALRWGAPIWAALGGAAALALHGPLAWAFVSGMETGLMVCFTLLTLWYVARGDRRGAVMAGVLTALIRPEGLVIGGLAALYAALAAPQHGRWWPMRRLPILALPVGAALVQPAINLLLTGSLTASGMQAKSYLYNVPTDTGAMLAAMLRTAGQVWGGLYADPVHLTTAPLLVGLLAVIFAGYERLRLLRRPALPLMPPAAPVLLIAGWLLGLTAMIATLETASWQFKRYQQPMVALLFALALWCVAYLTRRDRLLALGGVAVLLGVTLQSISPFVTHYAENVREVAGSQAPMARFVTETLPPEAIVGVHDIGVMRYLGTHATYDLVGLTTPGAARPWRHGPGAVYEQMRASPWRPGYFAIYPDARGLTYFEGTGLFREVLAAFPSTHPTINVASATDSGQNVYRADWTFAAFADDPWQPSSLAAIAGLTRVDAVNIAHLPDEDAHAYRWWQAVSRPGFATEVYELTYIDCAAHGCTVLDGGRLLTGGESMRIATRPGEDLIWIMRVHPRDAVTLRLWIDDQPVGTRVIPAVPGRWLEIASFVPGALITGGEARVRVEADITDPAAGHYMPYYHWFYQGTYHPNEATGLPGPGATFGEAIELAGRRLTYDAASRALRVDIAWRLRGAAPFDAVTFVHLYDESGRLIEAAQLDRRPGAGTLPPANWLPGTLRDGYTLNVPPDVAQGVYRVAIGLYDPVTLERLPVTGEGADLDRRLFIGQVTIR